MGRRMEDEHSVSFSFGARTASEQVEGVSHRASVLDDGFSNPSAS
jgi:hypothetical protein